MTSLTWLTLALVVNVVGSFVINRLQTKINRLQNDRITWLERRVQKLETFCNEWSTDYFGADVDDDFE